MIMVVPKPRMNVIVVTIPPKTDLISEPGLPLISIPGFSVVVFNFGFHWRPNFVITLPCAGHSSCPFNFGNSFDWSACCCCLILASLSNLLISSRIFLIITSNCLTPACFSVRNVFKSFWLWRIFISALCSLRFLFWTNVSVWDPVSYTHLTLPTKA